MHWIALQPLHDVALSGAATGPPEPANRGDGLPVAGDDPQALADDLQALGWWGLRFTPRVVVHALAQAVLLEVSASERLFGGRRQLIVQLLAPGRPSVQIRVARAPTALLALARLQVEPAAGRDPDQLPLYTLADARPHLATLDRLGCQTWGDLRALPRGGVVRRFGAPLLDALDRAYGLQPEVYPWLVLPEVFDVPLELQAQVETAPALLFAARRLLAQMQVWLQARKQGVLAFALCWQMDARRNTASEGELVIRTAVPTLDMAHLQRLLAENLERITLPAPVLYLRLRSIETAALEAVTTSLLPDEQRKGDDLTQLLERLAARLGTDQVLRAVARADHRPEQMQAWVPAADGRSPGFVPGGADGTSKGSRPGGGGTARAAGKRSSKRRAAGPACAVSDALYPTWLLAMPLKLAVHRDRPLYQGPLTLLVGPQRLETAWWDVALSPGAAASGPACPVPDPPRLALRDYFLAHNAQAGLLWVYRERLMAARAQGDKQDGQWYLHGVFG
ncbi:MAG: DNA polymerase Y family protein [Burkholderiaceae bacterium]